MGVNDFIKIGDRIKSLRKERGMQQKEMAALLKIPVSTYSNYENGYREPTKETIEKIAKFLEIDVTLLRVSEEEIRLIAAEQLEILLEELRYIRDFENNPFLESYSKLNQIGKKKVLEYIEDLSEQPKYQKNSDH